MTDFLALCAQVPDGASNHIITIPDSWMQGRTTYGGLTAALCHEAAVKSFPDLPPLRAAEICFIGPAGGDVEIRSRCLRKGKSTIWIEAELTSPETGLATKCIFCFARDRASQLAADHLAMPQIDAPGTGISLSQPGLSPQFNQYFDIDLVKGNLPGSGDKSPGLACWTRFRDNTVPLSMTALLALGDAPPPAALPSLDKLVPISSMTWSLSVLDPAPVTEDGWVLLVNDVEKTQNGYSSQNMISYTRDGRAIMAGRQTVAIFG